MLLADMLNTIFREVTALSTHSNESQRDAAISNVALLTIIGLIIFPGAKIYLSVLYHWCEDDYPDECTTWRRVIISVVQTLGAMLYIYGDNIGYILHNYSEELGCGEQCVANNRIGAVITLGLALIILQLFPVALKKLDVVIKEPDGFDCSKWNDKTSKWNSGLDLITIIVKIDILYTAIAVMTQTNEFCGHIDLALSSTFIAASMLIGIAIMIVDFFYSGVKIDNDNSLFILVPTLVLMALSLCMYLLADNAQPLDCGFGCDTFAANQTMNIISCNAQANRGLRFGFTFVTFIMVISLALIWICIVMRSDKTVEEVDGSKEVAESGHHHTAKVV